MAIRNGEDFDMFWKKVNKMASDLDVTDSVLPRWRKMPMTFEESNTPPKYPSTPKARVCIGEVTLPWIFRANF